MCRNIPGVNPLHAAHDGHFRGGPPAGFATTPVWRGEPSECASSVSQALVLLAWHSSIDSFVKSPNKHALLRTDAKMTVMEPVSMMLLKQYGHACMLFSPCRTRCDQQPERDLPPLAQTEASLPTLLSRLSGLFGAPPPMGPNPFFQVAGAPKPPQAPGQDEQPPGGSAAASSAQQEAMEPSSSAMWRTFSDMMQARKHAA